MLVFYDSIYQQQGWCNLWSKLIEDNLVGGDCPRLVDEFVRENVSTPNGTKSLVTGARMKIDSDIQVFYTACINFGPGEVSYTGGTVEDYYNNSRIGTNLTAHSGSYFTLYFRCDNAWSP
jgi:hypothetical protein